MIIFLTQYWQTNTTDFSRICNLVFLLITKTSFIFFPTVRNASLVYQKFAMVFRGHFLVAISVHAPGYLHPRGEILP